MGLKRETYYAMYQRFRDKVMETAPIGQFHRGGKARTFIELVASEFGNFYDNILYDVTQHFLKFASGDMLDALGDMFGVYRLPQTQAKVTASEKCIKLYVDSGTFGDINSSTTFTVPAGTTITATDGTTYSIDYGAVCPYDASELYISATAVSKGKAGNVGKGQLNQLNFTGYTNSTSNSLKVENVYSIGSGTGEEVDSNFRYRISLRFLELERCNIFAIYAALLAIPGVRDLRFKRFADGIGTTRVYLYGIYPDQSLQLVQQAQDVVDSVAAAGEIVHVVSPDVVGVTIKTNLVFNTYVDSGVSVARSITTAAANDIVTKVKNNLADYFSDLPIEETLVPEKITSVIMGTDASIKDIGTASTAYDYILLTRTLPNGRTSTKYMTENYTPKLGELLTLNLADIYV